MEATTYGYVSLLSNDAQKGASSDTVALACYCHCACACHVIKVK